ncbi:MAG: YlxR family protein [Clostridiales bacterium]|nr:YlxR family protein [Clostridiales bacterium]
MRERREPMRRCVGCMTSFPKKNVVRIAFADGKLMIDKAGRQDGRGAYICRSIECFDAAVKKKRFNYALRVNVKPEETADLREEYAKHIADAEVDE